MEENRIMEEKMIVIKGSKTFCFNFDWPKYPNENLKHENMSLLKTYQLITCGKI